MKKIKLSIRNLRQSYGEKRILKGVDLEIFEGETVVILGSSGCGKTSLLKSVAGLIPVESGRIFLDGQSIESRPPQERRAAMIFQNYALFPHMNVRENLEYGLKIKRLEKGEIRRRATELIDLLKLSGLEERPVSELSGGQQQRVAIGRAMIVEPAVMLFDEPLSNLDENLRKSMRRDIKKIIRSANSTSLYVTHDQVEAMAMADRIVVMNNGRIEQIAPPEELYYKPANRFVARFLGYTNIFEAEETAEGVRLFDRDLTVPSHLSGRSVQVLIRPEDIGISQPEDENAITLSGEVVDREMIAGIRSYIVETDRGRFSISVLNRTLDKEPEIGGHVLISLDPRTLHYFAGEETSHAH